MPKYRFTTDDGRSLDASPDQVVLPDDEAAAREAQRALADMLNENLPDGPRLNMRVAAENEAGEVVYQASLEFNGGTASDMRMKAAEAGKASMNGRRRPDDKG